MSHGYNIHTGHPMHYGGIMGSGHSLGGLLLGGAKLTPEQKLQRKIYNGKRKLQARQNLEHLIDAEKWASVAAGHEGHPEYADWLTRDYVKDIKLLQKKSLPSWAGREYTYGERFGPPRVYMPLTDEQKMMRREDRLAKELRKQELGIPKIFNPRTGRMVYIDTPIGKKILRAQPSLSAFQTMFRNRPSTATERLISNVDEYQGQLPLSARERSNANLRLGPTRRAARSAASSVIEDILSSIGEEEI